MSCASALLFPALVLNSYANLYYVTEIYRKCACDVDPFGDSLTFTTFHVVSLANDELDDGENGFQLLQRRSQLRSAFIAGLTQKRASSDQKKFVKIAD